VAAEPASAAHRVSFFAEQQRRRRQTWQLLAASFTVVSLIGLIASTVMSPIVFAVAGLTLRLTERLAPNSSSISAVRRAIVAWVDRGIADLNFFFDHLDRVQSLGEALALTSHTTAFLALLTPGIVAMLAFYLALRRFIRRSVGDGIARALKARAAVAEDFAEHRLANIVDEMALAAGIGVPRLLMVDEPMANAAAFRSGKGEAIVLVTRGLVASLDRSETEAVIGHLMGSLGNGDWRLICSLMAVFETLGLFLSIIDVPFRAGARRAIWRVLRIAVWRGNNPEEAAQLGELLAESIDTASLEETGRFLGSEKGGSRLRKIMTAPLLPLALINVLLRLVLWLWVSLLLGTAIALLWRKRRYLADASAIQLTRDPDALAGALRKLALSGGIPVGAAAIDYLFFCGPRGQGDDGFGSKRGIFMPMHPPLQSRMRRIVAMGATSDARSGRSFWRGAMPLVGCLALILAPLLAILFAAVAYLTLMVLTLTSAAAAMVMAWALG
jgi:Zn-dependent protease with chaperone function